MILETVGKHRISFQIDENDYLQISNYRWYAVYQKNGDLCAIRATSKKPKKLIYLHRLIMKPPAGLVVDHKNGDPSDNRRKNLRVCTQGENCRNYKKPNTNTSGYKGVFYNGSKEAIKKWRACIRVNNKTRHLGSFSTPEEAYTAYCEEAKKEYGEYARLE